MAYVARLADYNIGGVVGEVMPEGTPVIITASGAADNELPTFMKAGAGVVNNVGIIIKNPDDFPRPTPEGMYTAGRLVKLSDVFNEPITSGTFYKVGRSTLRNPELISGELASFQRGGTFAVVASTFIDTPQIRTQGTKIKVGAGAKWEATSSETDAVGISEGYAKETASLIITLWH